MIQIANWIANLFILGVALVFIAGGTIVLTGIIGGIIDHLRGDD